MAGLDPAIHLSSRNFALMDARIKSGHDEHVPFQNAKLRPLVPEQPQPLLSPPYFFA
jgi:hypothetical protein